MILVITTGGAAEKTKRGPIAIAGDDGREDSALDATRRVLIARRTTNWHSYFVIVGPGLAVIGRDGDVRPSIAIDVTEVNRVIGADTYGRIAGADAIRHGLIDPGETVIARDSRALASGSGTAEELGT